MERMFKRLVELAEKAKEHPWPEEIELCSQGCEKLLVPQQKEVHRVKKVAASFLYRLLYPKISKVIEERHALLLSLLQAREGAPKPIRDYVDELEKVFGHPVVVRREEEPKFLTFLGGKALQIPSSWFSEMLLMREFSLHHHVMKVLSERKKRKPGEEEWVEAHRRILELLEKHDNERSRLAASEYLSHLLAGAAAHELLGGKASVPQGLRQHVEEYKKVMGHLQKEVWKQLAKYYERFVKALSSSP